MVHGRVTKATYADLVDKVRAKLSGWKAKTLSFAGRATLANSVASAMIIFIGSSGYS